MNVLVEDFLQYLRHERGQSDNTAKTYAALLGKFTAWAEREKLSDWKQVEFKHLMAFLSVCGIHVEEDGLATYRLDLPYNSIHVPEGRLSVHVHAEDVQAAASQLQSGGLAESAGSAKDESPPVERCLLSVHVMTPSREGGRRFSSHQRGVILLGEVVKTQREWRA